MGFNQKISEYCIYLKYHVRVIFLTYYLTEINLRDFYMCITVLSVKLQSWEKTIFFENLAFASNLLAICQQIASKSRFSDIHNLLAICQQVANKLYIFYNFHHFFHSKRKGSADKMIFFQKSSFSNIDKDFLCE